MFYVYMVRCNDNSLYTGWTTDVKRRTREHNQGIGAKYTRTRLPVVLVYIEEVSKKQEAMKREYVIKKLKKKQKEEISASWLENLDEEMIDRSNKYDKCNKKMIENSGAVPYREK